MKTITLKHALPLIPLLVVCFALSPTARAVSPPPDGGYPGQNTAEGDGALFSLTSGIDNTALGFQALYHNTTGNYNTAEGLHALLSNTIGGLNTATGVNALRSNTTGSANTANGMNALISNTTGNFNTANGLNTLYRNTTGFGNVANGYQALFSNTGLENTAIGVSALYSNTMGSGNVAIGARALFSNTDRTSNTAIGSEALASNEGSQNTAIGALALFANATGNDNIALGVLAGSNVTTAGNVIAIGSFVAAEDVSNTCYIGNIFGTTSAGATAVYVNSLGKLGTVVSSRRFKDEIKPMDKASEAILALKPVTFRYKPELDADGIPQFGLVAEDVEKVNPDLVARDDEGKVYTVRYDAVNAMLLNEFLKEHRKVEQLEKQIEALTAGLQKVSAQLEASKTTPQIVLNIQ